MNPVAAAKALAFVGHPRRPMHLPRGILGMLIIRQITRSSVNAPRSATALRYGGLCRHRIAVGPDAHVVEHVGAGDPRELDEGFVRGHHRNLGGRLGELGDTRGKSSFFIKRLKQFSAVWRADFR
jgi:hypothetical protein